MKPLLALIALFGFVPVLLTNAHGQSADDAFFLQVLDTDREGQPAPIFPFLDPTGHEVTIADYKGKTLVINFWATWCAPCIHEMPTLDRLNQLIEGTDGLVITINTDFVPEDGVIWLAENEIESLQAFYDSTGNAFFDAGGRGLPYTLIVNPEGEIVAEVFGDAPWDTSAAVSLIQSL